MALFKPNQLSPQDSTIDATLENRFSWQTNGGVQTGYRVYIYNNDTGVLAHDTTQVSSPNEYYDLPASTLSNGQDWKWYVTTSSGAQSQDSEYEFFNSNLTPVVSFTAPNFSVGYKEVTEDFQDDANWTLGVGDLDVNYTNYLAEYGTQSLDLYDANGSRYVYIYKDTILNLEELDNGILPDQFELVFYITVKSKLDTGGMELRFYTDGSNYYTGTILEAAITDASWNYITIAKTSFVATGTPDWATITKVEVGFNTDQFGLAVYYQAIEAQKSLGGDGVIIGTQDYTFEMNYAQAQNVSSKKYKYILSDSDGEELSDTGWIYDFTLSYEITGMSNNTIYQIEGLVVSQNEQESTTGVEEFTIQYVNNNALPEITATNYDALGYNLIDWSNIQFREATYSGSGDPSYVTGKFNYGLDLPDGENIDLGSLTTTTCYTLTAWIQMKLGHDGDFALIGTNASAGYDLGTQRFYYNNDGTYTYSGAITLYSWEDLSGDWTGYASDTWATLGVSGGDYMTGFFFFGLTCADYVIKKANEVRVHLDIT